MRTHLDCLPCLLNQALKAARAATADEELHRHALNAVAAIIPELPMDMKPPEIAQQCYRLVYEVIGDNDPFRGAKDAANRAALGVYPKLKQIVAGSEDPLLTACKLAIAGNSIDLGPGFDYGSMDDIVGTAVRSPLAVDRYAQFAADVKTARGILYLGDNAGETVFDRVLIEELRRAGDAAIMFVVRDRPVINDATLDDALVAGIDDVAEVVSSGSDAPATILSQCSTALLELYHAADVIVSKGQGNYESLSEEPENIYFFLRAKCELVAELLGVAVGDAVLERGRAAD